MPFHLIISCVNNPVVFYDGGERQQFPLTVQLGEQSVHVAVDPLAPECREWRHYYHDVELNELANQLRLRFEFRLNGERAIDPTHGRLVYFQPFWCGSCELSVCYSYDEVSNGHYVFWLLAAFKRSIEEAEFSSRIANIKKYWLK